ncbi:MAG: FtsQ-type POTRA domain-containing protein, partial [Candidatus Eremiobacteraeota bacterium]|nr:FtsQ-type POTRA domain-containing protein [Candidatus Eremiobacteraeota bacterium]
DAAAIAPDANVWLIDTRAVQQRIEAIPYVDRASVRRAQFPHPAVELAVTVRRPADCLRGDGGTVTVDAAARVLQRGCAVPAAPLVVASAALPAPGQTVSDASVTRLLRDEAILVQAGLGLRRIARDRWAGLEIVDRSGVTVRFGDDADLPHKAALVGPVRAGIGTRRPVAAIDLRAPATPIVEFR